MASPCNEPDYAGRPLAEWLADLDAPDVKTREFASSALWDIALACHLDDGPIPPAVIRSLVDALRDPEGRVRANAAKALGVVGAAAQDCLPELLDLLADDEEEDRTRAEVASAVGVLGGARDAHQILLRLLREGSEGLREAAGAALRNGDLSGLDAEGELQACLTDESPVVRTSVCWSLWKLTNEAGDLIPILLSAMRARAARMDAARLLCLMKGQAVSALPELLALRDDEDWGVRLQAVRATTHIPCSDELAMSVLEGLRDDPNEVVRSYAAGAIQQRSGA